MRNSKSIASASVDAQHTDPIVALEADDGYRMLRYQELATAFSYPTERLAETMPGVFRRWGTAGLQAAYDRLFRSGIVWLYTTEHQAENEFERARQLSDISGFYRVFGVEATGDRPDSLSAQLEFMHLLIYKRMRAVTDPAMVDSREKADICREAEEHFFSDFLVVPAAAIAEKILRQGSDGFYAVRARELLEFMESERLVHGGSAL